MMIPCCQPAWWVEDDLRRQSIEEQDHEVGNTASDRDALWHGNHDVHRQSLIVEPGDGPPHRGLRLIVGSA